MGEKDKTTKTLESYNSVFADIVNGFLFDGKQIVHEDELIPAEKESQFKTGGKILSQERDVSKFWMNMNIRIALIGCENQSIPDRLMALRVIGYDGSDYKRQYNEIISGESNAILSLLWSYILESRTGIMVRICIHVWIFLRS